MSRTVISTFFVLFLMLLSTLNALAIPVVTGSTTHHVYPGQSIQEAINSALSGDTIFIHSGTYDEEVLVDKAVSLIGENRSTTFVEGPNAHILVTANDVTVANLTIHSQYGTWPSIRLEYCVNGLIIDNNVENGDEGVRLVNCNNCSIVRNSIRGSMEYPHGDMLYILGSSYCTVENNTITNAQAGIKWSNGYALKVVGNSLVDNNYGMLAGTSNVSIISKNTLRNGVGIRCGALENVTFFHNDFSNWGIQVQLTTTSSLKWDDGYPSGGNYWSDYNGADIHTGPYQNITGSDGIGDTPHVIDASNQDNYPLVIPDVALINIHNMKTGCLPMPTVSQNMTMNVYVTIDNQGNVQETFNITAYANSTLIGKQNVTLDAGENTILTFSWNTTGLPEYAFYIISANVTHLLYETDLADNSLVDGNITITHMGDITGDGKVDIQDVARVSGAFGTVRVSDPQDPHYNQYWHPTACAYCPHSPNADINGDGKVDISDLARTSGQFGWHR